MLSPRQPPAPVIVRPCSPRRRQLLLHAAALNAAPSWAPERLLPKCLPLAEEEEAEAELSWEVSSAFRHGNLLYLPSIEENLPKPWHFTTRGLTSCGILSLGQPVVFLLVLACCFLDSVKPNCCCTSPPTALSWKQPCQKLVALSPPELIPVFLHPWLWGTVTWCICQLCSASHLW